MTIRVNFPDDLIFRYVLVFLHIGKRDLIEHLMARIACSVFTSVVVYIFAIFNFNLLSHILYSSFEPGSSCLLGVSTICDVWNLSPLLLYLEVGVHCKMYPVPWNPHSPRYSKNWKIWTVDCGNYSKRQIEEWFKYGITTKKTLWSWGLLFSLHINGPELNWPLQR